MNILIIDDDKNFCIDMKNKLSHFLDSYVDNAYFQIYSENITDIQFKDIYDLAFIDINLPDIDGIELAKKLKIKNICSCIVFITSHSHLVFDSLMVHPFFFIRKEFFEKDFSVFLNLLPDTFESHHFIMLRWKEQKRIIHSEKIIYIESYGRDLIIHTVDGDFHDSRLLGEILIELPESSFIRIHRSYIINYNYIKNFSKNDIQLMNNDLLCIGRKYKSNFEKGYMKYIKNGIF